MPDCSFCLAQNIGTGFACGWCSASSSSECLFNEECSSDEFFNESSSCPKPMIQSITPSKGPPQGGTTITISGTNLGVTFTDILNVTVGDLPCNVIEWTYIPGQKIMCIVSNSSENKMEIDASVIVYVKRSNEIVLFAKGAYSFLNPVVESIIPKLGPVSGGTRVRVVGSNLDIGSTDQTRVNFLLADDSASGQCIIL